MERCDRPLSTSQHRRGRSGHQSFSSSLLDAIFRSIDEDSSSSSIEASARDLRRTGTIPDSLLLPQKKRQMAADYQWVPAVAVRERPMGRRSAGNCHHRCGESTPASSYTSSSSTSSSVTASSGFSKSSSSSSSSANSVRPNRATGRPDPPVHAVGSEKKKKKRNCGLIGNRIRNLKKRRQPSQPAAVPALAPAVESAAASLPASPGGRLASFLNALFSAAAGNRKKAKITVVTAAPMAAMMQGGSAGGGSGCREDPRRSSSSSSSCRRSCLIKTQSSWAPAAAQRRASREEEIGKKRSVRFCSVSVIVGDDSRPCGEERLHASADDEGRVTEDERPARVRVEELLRGATEEEEVEDGRDSDSSSDLFELENLATIGGVVVGGYRDELPVFETTTLKTNRAIAHGLII